MAYEVTIAGITRRVEVQQAEEGRYRVIVDGREVEGVMREPVPGILVLGAEGRSAELHWHLGPEVIDLAARGSTWQAVVVDERQKLLRGLSSGGRAVGPTTLRASMPGKVVTVLAAEGQRVVGGGGLVVIEAMKMENELKAPFSCRVSRVAVAAGDTVEAGHVLVEVEPVEEEAS